MSLNGRTEFNLNTGKLTMQNTDFELGGSADIHFTDSGNRLYYQRFDDVGRVTRSAGVGFGTSINDRFPFTYLGTARNGKPHAMDEHNFTGFIANTRQRELTDGIGQSVVGQYFHVRDKAVSFSQGFLFDLSSSTRSIFRPINTGTYDTYLGVDGNRWKEVWAWEINGAINNTSTINAKMGIEDVDARKASDYFNMMNVKSYYYKGEDYTDKYKRRVSPIIEQLDPVLENLYKSNENSLDVISNFWLYVIANQHDKRIINERLEALEQYVKGDE